MAEIPLSVTIISYNEENNISKAIQSASWANEVIVVDSGSTDQTKKIAQNLGAQVYENPWIGYGQQKNFAHQKTKNEWVLNIDADEVISPTLKEEIIKKITLHNQNISGFYIPRKTFFLGKWIQFGGWYPNYLLRLSKKNESHWSEPSIHETLIVNGKTDKLHAPIEHYTFKDIEDQVRTNIRYAYAGAQDRIQNNKKTYLIQIFLKPIGKFLETYILKRGFLDGLPGLIISINAAYSIFLKYLFAYEKQKLGKKS